MGTFRLVRGIFIFQCSTSQSRRPILFRVSWALIIINVSLLHAPKHSMRRYAVAAEQHQLTVSWRRRQHHRGLRRRRHAAIEANGVKNSGGADMNFIEATASANRKLPPLPRLVTVTGPYHQHFPESRRRRSASCGAGGRGTTGLGAGCS
jgi:predicted DNA-binding WGR domain protein